MHWRGGQDLVWGARGPFPPAAAMVVAVMMPTVFVLRILKNAIKTLKLVVHKEIFYLLLYIVKNIAIHVMLIVGVVHASVGQKVTLLTSS